MSRAGPQARTTCTRLLALVFCRAFGVLLCLILALAWMDIWADRLSPEGRWWIVPLSLGSQSLAEDNPPGLTTVTTSRAYSHL